MKFKILAGLLSLVSVSALAAGDAGCGLGSVVISKNSKGLQLVAMTTNASFFSQPLGITSGTSNCSSSGLVSNDKAVEYYVEANQNEILKDMAMGSGEKIETLATLYGCSTDQAKQEFKSLAKQEFQLINQRSDNTQNWITNFNSVVKANKDKVSSCSQI
jgi:hypothetical protein